MLKGTGEGNMQRKSGENGNGFKCKKEVGGA
jgi:hypothetical protein